MQAGAKHVYGIERSAIAEQAKQIVADNGYTERVTIIQGKVEEAELPVDKVRHRVRVAGSACAPGAPRVRRGGLPCLCVAGGQPAPSYSPTCAGTRCGLACAHRVHDCTRMSVRLSKRVSTSHNGL